MKPVVAAAMGGMALLVSANALAQFPIPPFGPAPAPAPQPYGTPNYYPAPVPVQKRPETPAGALGGAVAGFRASRLDADIEGADDSYGFLASGASVAVLSVKFLTMRAALDAHVGGGSEDVEARIGGHLTFGVIGHWAQTNGAFIRVGVGGNYEGNGRYTFSHFDLPLGEGGFQLHTRGFGLEAGFRGGATLTGRVGMAPSANREYGVTGRWGGYVTLAAGGQSMPYPGGWLDIEFVRFEDERPIHVGSGRVCGGFWAFACLDGRIIHSDLDHGTALGSAGVFDGAVSFYAGATIGIGAAPAVNGVSSLIGF